MKLLVPPIYFGSCTLSIVSTCHPKSAGTSLMSLSRFPWQMQLPGFWLVIYDIKIKRLNKEKLLSLAKMLTLKGFVRRGRARVDSSWKMGALQGESMHFQFCFDHKCFRPFFACCFARSSVSHFWHPPTFPPQPGTFLATAHATKA